MTKLSRHPKAFTLIEIMIVVAVIGVIVAIAVPAYLRSREVSRARACQVNLSKVEGALIMYAMEGKLNNGETVPLTSLIREEGTGYLKVLPHCPSGGTYGPTLTVNSVPVCSIGENVSASIAPHVLGSPATEAD